MPPSRAAHQFEKVKKPTLLRLRPSLPKYFLLFSLSQLPRPPYHLPQYPHCSLTILCESVTISYTVASHIILQLQHRPKSTSAVELSTPTQRNQQLPCFHHPPNKRTETQYCTLLHSNVPVFHANRSCPGYLIWRLPCVQNAGRRAPSQLEADRH